MILQGQEVCPHLSYRYQSPIRWSNSCILFLQDLKQTHEMVWLTAQQYMQNMPDSTTKLNKERIADSGKVGKAKIMEGRSEIYRVLSSEMNILKVKPTTQN